MALSDLQKYQMLNTVVPYFNKTMYPYNKITADKIVETQKEITLTYQHQNMFFPSPQIKSENDKKKKGGFVVKQSIVTGHRPVKQSIVAGHRPVKKITVLLYDIF